ncbi:MAG: histidine phosphatase family protein [Bacteroidaceae bacterium]|nr:histidine phosphatase family protein [Bacteroidaceae bacterium]
MKKSFLISLVLLLPLTLCAEITKKEDINKDNLYKFRGSMLEYVDPGVTYSKAPKGFKPFYMSHYGRHGSRYLLNTPQYNDPYSILQAADDKGVLTDFGKDVLRRIEIMAKDADGHLGDLTIVGQQQHRGIARRMVRNYPEIFNKKTTIVARSTTSHRVMASMTAAMMEFSSILPQMKIDYNCSDYDRGYMNSEDRAINSAKNSRERNAAVNAFNAKHNNPERLMCALFTDTTFITRYQRTSSSGSVSVSDRSDDLYTKIYDIAANMGSHSYLGFDLDDVFTFDEWYDCWLQNNLYWFSVSGYHDLTNNIVPYGHATLLQDFLDKADAAIAAGTPSANLRYGHDTALYPLLCLMEVNDCAYSPKDIEDLADKWVNYDIVHMASNLQLIFFKDKKGKILVRALVDEKEAKLPVECYKDAKGVEYPYFYEWDKLEKYYRDILNKWTRIRAELTSN